MMIAGALSFILVLPAYGLLRRTYEVVDMMGSRFRLNEQARQAFALLADGSVATSGGASVRGFGLVEGLRSRCVTYVSTSTASKTLNKPLCNAQGPSSASLRTASQLVISDGGLSVKGDEISPATVVCRGLGSPLPDCTGTETRTVRGWLGSDPTLSTTGRIRTLGLTITDPFRAQRAGRLPATATEMYRTMFTFNAEADP